MTLPERDYLWLHIRDLPYFRALLRAVESRLMQQVELPQPVLDIGSGDGHFASVTYTGMLDVGVDPAVKPTREARQRGAYRLLVQADGTDLPCADGSFARAPKPNRQGEGENVMISDMAGHFQKPYKPTVSMSSSKMCI